jgi:hypothetical protein
MFGVYATDVGLKEFMSCREIYFIKAYQSWVVERLPHGLASSLLSAWLRLLCPRLLPISQVEIINKVNASLHYFSF